MASETGTRRLGWKELGGAVLAGVVLLLLWSTLSPRNNEGNQFRTTNFILRAKQPEEPGDPLPTAMTSSTSEETDTDTNDISHEEMAPADVLHEAPDIPESTVETTVEHPVTKTEDNTSVEGTDQLHAEDSLFGGREDDVTPAPFKVYSFSRMEAIETAICSSCQDGSCTEQCQCHKKIQNYLNATNTEAEEDVRLFVTMVEPLAWLRTAADQPTDYQATLQAFAKAVKSQSHYRTFKGSDHVIICISDGCQELGESLAEALSGSMSLGTRAIFAGVGVDGNTMKWPCPLRVIHLDSVSKGDAAAVVQKVVQRATFMIEKRNRWICADAAHPVNHWDGVKKRKVKGAYMKKFGFSICAIPKCGSSMTDALLRRMMGYENWNQTGTGINHGRHSGIKYVSHLKNAEQQALNANTSFVRAVIVRHPVSRLLSGYLDKIHDKRQLGRVPGLKACVKKKKLSFEVFVNCLIRKHKTPNHLDHHFRSQSSFCNVRHNELDFIGKQSSLAEDMKEFSQSLNFWEDYVSNGWGENGEFGKKSQQTRAHNSSSKIWGHYTEDLIEKVYKYYQEDFVRFGFTVEEILETKPKEA